MNLYTLYSRCSSLAKIYLFIVHDFASLYNLFTKKEGCLISNDYQIIRQECRYSVLFGISLHNFFNIQYIWNISYNYYISYEIRENKKYSIIVFSIFYWIKWLCSAFSIDLHLGRIVILIYWPADHLPTCKFIRTVYQDQNRLTTLNIVDKFLY